MVKERKVKIVWTDKHGQTRMAVRWLSQVDAFVAKRRAHGDLSTFAWQAYDDAPWREVR